ncbi:hypothetical protein V6N11_021846 [Hibiscus sabdariffa]|uniref:GRF-type domain-containing protein n=1 Tax=Hibiscus sabdariffa TaxID=183260 RepID=A0ABR2TIE5_9ROSI
MEGKGRRVTTKPSDWDAGIEEPTTFLMCRCGFPAQLRTSWSNDNPGRRFFGCKNHGSVVHHACRFFSWFDPPMKPLLDWLNCWPPLTSACKDCIHLTLIPFPGIGINTNVLICGDSEVVGMTGGDDDVAITCGDAEVVGMTGGNDNVVALLTCIIQVLKNKEDKD